MARSAGTAVENNFTKGLITEATGLNFPENATTETWNCIFRETGQVRRRKGINWEVNYELGEAVSDSDLQGAVVEYIWKAVSSSGVLTFTVIQFGTKIVFYVQKANEDGPEGLSSGRKGFTIDITDYSVFAANILRDSPCSFASGSGYLFITNPKALPIVVAYNLNTNAITVNQVNIAIRDFEGVKDGLGIGEQPDTLTNLHWYNLKNQGWWKDVLCVDEGGGVAHILEGVDVPEETEETYFEFISPDVVIPGGDDDTQYVTFWYNCAIDDAEITASANFTGDISGDVTRAFTYTETTNSNFIKSGESIPIVSGDILSVNWSVSAEATDAGQIGADWLYTITDFVPSALIDSGGLLADGQTPLLSEIGSSGGGIASGGPYSNSGSWLIEFVE